MVTQAPVPQKADKGLLPVSGLPKDIQGFLDELVGFASRELPYRSDVGTLLHRAKLANQMPVFENLIFLAKFVSRTFEVMRRIGSDADGYQNLATEFKENAERAATLARTLMQEAPPSERKSFEKKYLGLDQESFGRLLGLLADLSWVKNWRVDGKSLP